MTQVFAVVWGISEQKVYGSHIVSGQPFGCTIAAQSCSHAKSDIRSLAQASQLPEVSLLWKPRDARRASDRWVAKL